MESALAGCLAIAVGLMLVLSAESRQRRAIEFERRGWRWSRRLYRAYNRLLGMHDGPFVWANRVVGVAFVLLGCALLGASVALHAP